MREVELPFGAVIIVSGDLMVFDGYGNEDEGDKALFAYQILPGNILPICASTISEESIQRTNLPVWTIAEIITSLENGVMNLGIPFTDRHRQELIDHSQQPPVILQLPD